MESSVEMPKFKENEKVLCYHDKLLYEAKVCGFKVDKRTKENIYHIHFIGWSKKWDIWTKADCILSWTRENLRKKDELDKESDDENGSEPVSLKRQLCDSHRKRGKRHNSEMSTSSDENLYELPEMVWDILQADEKLSTAGKSLKYANSEASILRMLTAFRTFRHEEIEKLSEKTTEQKLYLKSEVTEFCVGLTAMFDSLMPLQLLYQNDEQLPAHIKPVESCCIIHFCRFLTRLPQNLQEILVKSDCAATLRPYFESFMPWFINYLKENRTKDRISTFYRRK